MQLKEPVIICPYVCESDVDDVRSAFHLDRPEGRRLPFFFWKDEKMIGPERAYEYCWNQFPDRDVFIMHTDMSPLHDDDTNQWYDDLLTYVRTMPEAGMLACNLLYPLKSPDGRWYVQCAGGYFADGKIGYFGGGVDIAGGIVYDTARLYDDELKKVRKVAWVTFGGVYICREVLSACGSFDRRYHWAYVMDVDYSLEARLRGFGLYQVPITLHHQEARTTRPMMAADPKLAAYMSENFEIFYKKWDWWLRKSGTTF